jgi:hypothetical protein
MEGELLLLALASIGWCHVLVDSFLIGRTDWFHLALPQYNKHVEDVCS